MSIGKRIRAAREKSGLLQRELAAQLGIRQALVSKWERGILQVPPETLREISRILYVKENWLLYGGKETPRAGVDRKRNTVSYEHCAGCAHFIENYGDKHCDYIGDTDRMRPCPAGRDCTEYTTAAEWKENRKRARAEFNGYYPELQRKPDTSSDAPEARHLPIKGKAL